MLRTHVHEHTFMHAYALKKLNTTYFNLQYPYLFFTSVCFLLNVIYPPSNLFPVYVFFSLLRFLSLLLHSPFCTLYCTYVTAFDSVVMAISEAGGLNAIEELQNHPNQNIYQRAVKMLEVRTLLLLLLLLLLLSWNCTSNIM